MASNMYPLTQTSPSEKMTLIGKERHIKMLSTLFIITRKKALEVGEVAETQ